MLRLYFAGPHFHAIPSQVITLTGGTRYNHEGATPWVDPGYTAVDAFYGPISNVAIVGEVNYAQRG